MNAGLPGTGIGGLFYIATALVMPIHRATLGRGHDGRSWRRVALQAGIGAGILGALVATGWVMGLVLLPEPAAVTVNAAAASTASGSVIRWVAVIGTVGLLAVLLLAVELAGWIVRPREVAAPLRVVEVDEPIRPLDPDPAGFESFDVEALEVEASEVEPPVREVA